ncbi:MAG: helix-turn-helix domain-containing protein [Treponemataceae bacterium]|nr:helix-turn-helix domain-containing protein [Treponemataceae bacterium]
MYCDFSLCYKIAFSTEKEVATFFSVEKYRKQKNLTYRAIARTMGKAETTVSSMRQFGTEPRISDGIRLADALGVDIRDLAE